ncbi:MAG: deoxyguanosinetriphosphate triphosphohydrolase [Afipia sp.]
MSVGMAAPRVAYGCDPGQSRGRRFDEPPSLRRSAFRRDCDRVIHSTAFRRLKHKTQVFVFHEGDHYRTRLTHTLEVAQIARALARQLGLDEDLTETLALAHDLGHPPFGHAGERALDECLRDHGGFDHNAQSLRVVTLLERRYPAFDGLNLTWESLEGIVKHNGPMIDRNGEAVGRYREHGVPVGISEYVAYHDLELWSYASLEAQVAAVADDIAYDAHDIDDGLRAGLFTVDDLGAIPLIADINAVIMARYPVLDEPRRGAELVRELISYLIEDVFSETRKRLAAVQPNSAADVRNHVGTIVSFSTEAEKTEAAIKRFLKTHMYRHERVMSVMRDAETVVRDLFARYRTEPGDLPAEWLPHEGEDDDAGRARRIGDFIAGMTDRYAIIEHQRLFDLTPDLR